jgi:hypothetical protein
MNIFICACQEKLPQTSERQKDLLPQCVGKQSGAYLHWMNPLNFQKPFQLC